MMSSLPIILYLFAALWSSSLANIVTTSNGTIKACVAPPTENCSPTRLEDLNALKVNHCLLAPLTLNGATLLCDDTFVTNGEGTCQVECKGSVPAESSISCTKAGGWSGPAQCISNCLTSNGVFYVPSVGQDVYCQDGYMLVGTVQGTSSGSPVYDWDQDFASPDSPPLLTSGTGLLALSKFTAGSELKFDCTLDGTNWSSYTRPAGFSTWGPGDKGTYGDAQWGVVAEVGVFGRVSYWICGYNTSNLAVAGVGLCAGTSADNFANHLASFTTSSGSLNIGCGNSGTNGGTTSRWRMWVKAT